MSLQDLNLIRKAALFLGLKARSIEKAWYWRSDCAQTAADYAKSRYDLHALCGLVEDKVRERFPNLCVETLTLKGETTCNLFEGFANFEGVQFIHKGPLVARLGALVQLVEKIDA